jgi:hypothetical protein
LALRPARADRTAGPIRPWTTIRTQNPVTAGRSYVAQSSHFNEFEPEILQPREHAEERRLVGQDSFEHRLGGHFDRGQVFELVEEIGGHLATNVDLERLR